MGVSPVIKQVLRLIYATKPLFDANRRKPNLKNRTDEATENSVIAYAIEQPAHGQVRVSNELRQRGIFVSSSGVRSIRLRHDLASFKQRLAALEKRVAKEGMILTDTQIAALEKKQDDDVACGEIETRPSRLLGLAGHLLRWHDQRRGGVFTSRPLSTPTAKWRWPSSTRPRHPLLPQTY